MLSTSGYKAVTQAVALVDRSARVRLEIQGPDRAKFLHNLTTNEIKRLPVGRGCEAFVTSLQGKTLAFVTVLACADAILVGTDQGGLVLAMPHFQKYGVFDDIALEDRSDSTFELHLAGPRSADLVTGAFGAVPEPAELSHRLLDFGREQLLVVRESPTGRPGFTLIGPRAGISSVLERIREQGKGLDLADLDQEAFEVLRIEAGTPVFGRDVSEKNFPQEISRDERAINFVKGCYLGQETVARLDALGHVNQVLKGIRLQPDAIAPSPGSELRADGKRVGFVTSSAISPGWNAPVALAIVRNSHARAGSEVSVDPGARPALVCDLPMLPIP